jgi:hypothetical protein
VEQHALLMGIIGDLPDLLEGIDRSQFCGLGDGNHPGLHVVLKSDPMHVRSYLLNGQFPVPAYGR